MTIAVGFLHRDGVLLAGDTEHGAYTKFHESKLRHVICEDGKAIFAYAGNARAAWAAIDQCERKLNEAGRSTGIRATIEAALDRRYRRDVLSHPDYNDENVYYRLLIGIQSRGAKAEFYATQRNALYPVTAYDCIGIGEFLTRSLILQDYQQHPTEREALHLAAYVLAVAKTSVKDCGGASLFMSLRNDGSLASFWDNPPLYNDPGVHAIEQHHRAFMGLCRSLFLQHVDPNANDEDFSRNLAVFGDHMMRMRQEWGEFKQRTEGFAAPLLAEPNPPLTTTET
jgi:20S proteasome alpha/beta subunit